MLTLSQLLIFCERGVSLLPRSRRREIIQRALAVHEDGCIDKKNAEKIMGRLLWELFCNSPLKPQLTLARVADWKMSKKPVTERLAAIEASEFEKGTMEITSLHNDVVIQATVAKVSYTYEGGCIVGYDFYLDDTIAFQDGDSWGKQHQLPNPYSVALGPDGFISRSNGKLYLLTSRNEIITISIQETKQEERQLVAP